MQEGGKEGKGVGGEEKECQGSEDGGKEGEEMGGKEGWREGPKEIGREGGRVGQKEGEKKEGREEGKKEKFINLVKILSRVSARGLAQCLTAGRCRARMGQELAYLSLLHFVLLR